MATPEGSVDDIFLPGGRLRLDCFNDEALRALREGLRLARETRWDSIRSPHVFMGLLAVPDASVCNWGERLQADLSTLLGQFQELFYQEQGEEEAVLILNREFLSDNVITLLRDAYQRALDHQRSKATPMDLLISLLAAPYSIVAECFARIGVKTVKLIDLAVMAEHSSRGGKN
jgi:ATP-dependent Clp protease ATP-binding subunit ClpA